MSSTSSQELADSASVLNEQECEPSRSARSSHIVVQSSASDGLSFPSTKMFATLAPNGCEQMELGLTSSVAGSHAKTSASLDDNLAWKGQEAAYGAKSPVSLARFDRNSRSWRTSQISLLALANSQADGLELFSETWPRSGMTRNGIAYRLPPLVLLTREIGSGLWPTPTVPNGGRTLHHVDQFNGRTAYHKGKKVQVDLNAAVKLWPSPTAMDTGLTTDLKKIEARRQAVKAKRINGNGFGPSLGEAVRLYPTPTTQDATNNGGASQYERNSLPLNALIGGALNPTWVEWLMGYPIGWTALEPSETPSSRKSRKSSGERS